MKKVIFFDLDGTLIAGNSWFDFNLYFGMSEAEDQTLLDWYSRGIITYDEWDKIIVKILRDKGQCTAEKVAEFIQGMTPRPETIDLINACKEQGYTTIILSGTMKQVAEGFRQRVGIDLSYTTSEIMFSDDGMFETINNDKDEGPAKLRIYERLCEEHAVNPEDVMYVGDSRNDLEIFQKTKKGVLIGNYEKLKPFAWKQVSSLQEIIALL